MGSGNKEPEWARIIASSIRPRIICLLAVHLNKQRLSETLIVKIIIIISERQLFQGNERWKAEWLIFVTDSVEQLSLNSFIFCHHALDVRELLCVVQQVDLGNRFLVEGNIIEVVEGPILELGRVALQDIRN